MNFAAFISDEREIRKSVLSKKKLMFFLRVKKKKGNGVKIYTIEYAADKQWVKASSKNCACMCLSSVREATRCSK